ncbi:MAG: pyridoxal phosphate-dependent aminotransferase [Planctomycetota bacterium]|jgi:aspartate aminotransferase
MTLPLSERAAALQPSATLAIGKQARELRAQGRDVIAFGAGEPDFPVPDAVQAAVRQAVADGHSKYLDTAGLPALREGIAAKLNRDNGGDYAPDQILVCTGAKQALYMAMQVLAGPGDEILVPTPYWVSYPEMSGLAGATTTYVQTTAADGFILQPDALRAALTDRTKVLVLNSPSNPTGATYTAAQLQAVGAVAAEHGCAVLSDEIYEKLVYGDTPFTSFAAACPDLRDRTLIVNGFSKAYAMTGWRLGYVAGPQHVIAAAAKMQAHLTSNATSIVQHAALACLELSDADLAPMHAEFDRRRKVMTERLNAMPGVTCREPTGAFYCFPDVSGCFGGEVEGHAITDSDSFCAALLAVANVALVPGIAFGAEGHVRLSYATAMELIEQGLDRMRTFCEAAAASKG